MSKNTTTQESASKALTLTNTISQASKAIESASKAKAQAIEAKKAEKEALKALKEAEKAEDSKAKALASRALSKAQASKAKAEALEAQAIEAESKAKEAKKEALKALREGAKSLTIKAEAIRKGLNTAVKSLLESIEGASDSEIESLVAFACDKVADKHSEIRSQAEALEPMDIIKAYRTYSAYAIIEGEGEKRFKKVAKAVRSESGANVYTFTPSTNYTIGAIFRSPASNKRRGRKQVIFEASKVYEYAKGAFVEISKAEAQARIKQAEAESARQAEARAKAEAQAESDRLLGEKVRKAEAKAKAKSESEPKA